MEPEINWFNAPQYLRGMIDDLLVGRAPTRVAEIRDAFLNPVPFDIEHDWELAEFWDDRLLGTVEEITGFIDLFLIGDEEFGVGALDYQLREFTRQFNFYERRAIEQGYRAKSYAPPSPSSK